MPQRVTDSEQVMAALAQVPALADLLTLRDDAAGQAMGNYVYESELSALLLGYEYQTTQVPPLLRCLVYAPGEIVYERGAATAQTFYFIAAGAAQVRFRTDAHQLEPLTVGAHFGEMAVLNDAPRTATVHATEAGELCVMEVQRAALPFLRKLPSYARALDKAQRRNERAVFLRALAQRVTLSNAALEELGALAQLRILESGHQLFTHGTAVRRIFLLRHGWLRLSASPAKAVSAAAASVSPDAAMREATSAPTPTDDAGEQGFVDRADTNVGDEVTVASAGAALTPALVMAYLSDWQCFGWSEVRHGVPAIAAAALSANDEAAEAVWQADGVAVQRAEVLELSWPLLRERLAHADAVPALQELIAAFDLLGQNTQALLPVALRSVAGAQAANSPVISGDLPQAATAVSANLLTGVPHDLVAAQAGWVESGLAATRQLIALNPQRCTQCGNCVTACADLHAGTPLLQLGGLRITRAPLVTLQIPHACVHCERPACLLACPTNAIGRAASGRVVIAEASCTGCGDCVAVCPYGAMQLAPRAANATESDVPQLAAVSTPDTAPAVTTGATQEAIASQPTQWRAVNCDLCASTSLPSARYDGLPTTQTLVAAVADYGCVRNCPTQALFRFAPQALPELAQTQTGGAVAVAARGIVDPARHSWRQNLRGHIAGLSALVLLTLGLSVWARRYGLTQPLWGTWFHLRWATALLGTGALLIALSYVWRRRRPQARGALHHWLWLHAYAGSAALIALAFHHGTRRGSGLTTLLALAFMGLGASGLGQQWWLGAGARRLARAQAETDELRATSARRWLQRVAQAHAVLAALALALLFLHLVQVVQFSLR